MSRAKGKQGKSFPVGEPQVGDVVLVFEENLPRYEWKPALILALCPGTNHAVRSARIRLSSGHFTCRALTHLYPLGPPLRACTQEPSGSSRL